MRIDLHVHTSPRSPCSQIDPASLVTEARRLGLDGLCLTEHQSLWTPEEVAELTRESGVKIFRGNEITTNQGDMLVFGFGVDIKGVVTIQELREKVQACSGFMIAAHPFRGFKTFGIGQLQMTIDHACKRKAFSFVDGVEVRNGKVTEQENEMALHVSERLNLPGTAGSDAHRIQELGTWITDFERDIQSELDLVQELRAGRFTTGSAR